MFHFIPNSYVYIHNLSHNSMSTISRLFTRRTSIPFISPRSSKLDSLFIPNLYSFSPHPLRKASLLDGTRTMRNFLNQTALLENLTDRHCRRTRTVAYSRAAILSTGIPRHDSRRFPYIAQLAELSRSEQFHRLEISRMLLFFQIAGFGIIRDVTDRWYCSIYNVSGSCAIGQAFVSLRETSGRGNGLLPIT